MAAQQQWEQVQACGVATDCVSIEKLDFLPEATSTAYGTNTPRSVATCARVPQLLEGLLENGPNRVEHLLQLLLLLLRIGGRKAPQRLHSTNTLARLI